jgi:hypothetical protein
VPLYPSLTEMVPNPLYEEPPQYMEEEEEDEQVIWSFCPPPDVSQAPLIAPTIVPISESANQVSPLFVPPLPSLIGSSS